MLKNVGYLEIESKLVVLWYKCRKHKCWINDYGKSETKVSSGDGGNRKTGWR